MASPVKLVFDDEGSKHLEGDPQHAYFRKLTEALFPTQQIEVIKDSTMKAQPFPRWNKSTTSIHDHLAEVRSVAEDNIRLNHIKYVEEYYVALLTSVRIDETRAWLLQHEKSFKRDASVLLYCLLREFHSVHDERNALEKMQALPVYQDIEKLNADFNSLNVRVSSDFLTNKGRVLEYLKHVPLSVRTAGLLDARADENWSLLQLMHEATRVARQPGLTVSRSPGVSPGLPVSSPVIEHPVVPEPMEIGQIGAATGRGGGRGRGGYRGGRRGGPMFGSGGRGSGRFGGRGPVTCHRCQQVGHFAKDCLAPAPVAAGSQ